MEKIAIDLTWLRIGKVGGTEFYIHNILDGFTRIEGTYGFTPVLFAAEDNAGVISKWAAGCDDRFEMLIAPVLSEAIGKRLVWQNLHQNRFLKKHGISRCFAPTLFRPMLNGGVKYLSVVHDIQPWHYPKYHPFYETLYSKMCWHACAGRSVRTITISEFCRHDLAKNMHFDEKKIDVIYNAISVTAQPESVFDGYAEEFRTKYGREILRGGYYYTLCQMIPHKNLTTLISMMGELVKKYPDKILVLSGVSGYKSEELKKQLKDLKLDNNIFITGFVSDEVKFALMQNAEVFLFPSVFEGFGMPPIEAMMLGTPVVTTKCTSIPEVTQNMAIYVDDPYSAREWMETVCSGSLKCGEPDTDVYDIKNVASRYLECIKNALL